MKKYVQKISKYRPSALQGTLHFEVSRPRAGLAVEHPYEARAFSILLIALGVFIAAYLYFVTASVLHVMARTEATNEVQAIDASIGDLEQQYLALSETVSPQEAPSLGLSPVSNISYVYRPGTEALRTVEPNTI
jgi:hypothetical protein